MRSGRSLGGGRLVFLSAPFAVPFAIWFAVYWCHSAYLSPLPFAVPFALLFAVSVELKVTFNTITADCVGCAVVGGFLTNAKNNKTTPPTTAHPVSPSAQKLPPVFSRMPKISTIGQPI